MNRRNFIRAGGLALFGSLATPAVAGSFAGGSLGKGGDKQAAIHLALAHFGVSEEELKKVMTVALEKGGDYADLFFEHTFYNNIGLQDGTVNRCSSNIDFGMGVRVLAGDQSGYAYVENVSLDEMIKAARTAARIAADGKVKKPINLTEKAITKNYYAINTPWESVIIKDKMPYLQKLNDKIFSLDKRVQKVNASLSDKTSHVLF